MNKIIIVLLAWSSLGIQFLKAGDFEQQFEAANALYHSESYSEAADQYEAILKEGVFNKELFFNLGNTYYQLGEVAQSVYNYERALLLSPGDEDITYNLKLAQLLLQDKIEIVPPFILNVWFNNLINLAGVNTWLILAVVFIVLSFGLFTLVAVQPQVSLKRLILSAGLVLLILSGVFSLFTMKRYQQIFENPNAIIGAPTSIVKGSPSENATDIVILHEGTKVEVLSTYRDHAEIKIADGNVGWVMKDDLLFILINR